VSIIILGIFPKFVTSWKGYVSAHLWKNNILWGYWTCSR